MTLEEALATGLPLRRRYKHHWGTKDGLRNVSTFDSWFDAEYFVNYIAITAEDTNADDWEIQGGPGGSMYCAHTWVDVGFIHQKFVCKHCDVEKC
jgi:hypothetical protein